MNDFAATVRSSARAVLLAMLMGATAAPAHAATTEWRAELARGGDEGFTGDYPVLVVPVRDGFWLSGSSFEAGWIGRYATDGSRIGLQRFFGPIGSGRNDSRGDLVMRHGAPAPDEIISVDDCRVERGVLGAPRSVVSYDPGAPGGGDGVIEAGTLFGFGRSADLSRVQRDCRVAPMPAIDRRAIMDVRNIAGVDAAYVLASEPDGRPDELIRVDRTRVEWRLSLEGIGARGPYVSFAGVDAGGVGLLWSEFVGEAFRTRVARVTADGRLAWRRDFDEVRAGLVAWQPAPLLAHYEAQLAVRLEALDLDSGATRFVAGLPVALHGLQPLPGGRAREDWHVSAYDDESAGAVLEVATGGTARLRWRADEPFRQAFAELADGSLLVRRSDGAFSTSWSLVAPDVTFGAGRPLPDVGRAPVARAPRLLVSGPGDAMLVGYEEQPRAHIARVERDGRVAWDVASPPGRYGAPRLIAAAMHATRACALTESGVDNRLRCFDALTGAPAFDVQVEGSSFRWRLGAFGDAIHLVDARFATGPQGRVEVPQLRVFAPSGEERLRRDLPLEELFDTVSAFGPSGELLANSSNGVLAIAPDATLRWRVENARAFGRLANGGGAVLLETTFDGPTVQTEAARYDGDGQVRWRRGVDDATISALGPDWLVRDATTVRRIADADGSDRWSVPRSAPGVLYASAPDGSGFVEGAAWFDGGTGARVGSLVAPANVVASSLHRFDTNGGLLRLTAQVDGQDSVLALERFGRDAGIGPRARLAATGFWHAPSVPGQGIALAVDARNGSAEGRWLTFGPATGARIDAQRWYRLTGRTAIDGDSIALQIEAPQPAGFDGGTVAWRAVGTARWRMRDCARVELDFRIEDGELARGGLLVLERFDGERDCEVRPGLQSNVDVDLWSPAGDPARALMVAQQRDGTVLAAWPTFVPAGTDAGRPHWLSLQGQRDALRIERTLAGSFAEGATRNTLAIGSATLRRLGCNRLEIDYRFDADEVAAPFDGRRGRLALQRRGRCPGVATGE